MLLSVIWLAQINICLLRIKMNFPVYRKYSNNKSYFLITSLTAWTEYKLVGKRYVKFDFIANQFPEKLFIQDLLQVIEGIEISNEKEINALSA
jgi:hypothetical protein